MIGNYGVWIVDNMHANLVKKSKPLCEEQFSKIRHELGMMKFINISNHVINTIKFDFLMILMIDDYMSVAWWIEGVVGLL